MEDNKKLIESLLEKTVEYGKTSIELLKLNTLDKISDAISTFIPHSVVFLFIATFMFFLNVGLAFWLGQLLGNTFSGFFVVAAFYGIIAIILHFVMHKWLKKRIYDYIIKQATK